MFAFSHVTRQTQFEHPLAARYGQHYLDTSNHEKNQFSLATQILLTSSPHHQPIYANAVNLNTSSSASALSINSSATTTSSNNTSTSRSTDLILASLLEQHNQQQQTHHQKASTSSLDSQVSSSLEGNNVIYSNLPSWSNYTNLFAINPTTQSSFINSQYPVTNESKSPLYGVISGNSGIGQNISKLLLNSGTANNAMITNSRQFATVNNLNIDAALLQLYQQKMPQQFDVTTTTSTSIKLHETTPINGPQRTLTMVSPQRQLPLPLPPRQARVNNIVPANPYLTEEIPNWLVIYSQAPPEYDHKLQVITIAKNVLLINY